MEGEGEVLSGSSKVGEVPHCCETALTLKRPGKRVPTPSLASVATEKESLAWAGPGKGRQDGWTWEGEA